MKRPFLFLCIGYFAHVGEEYFAGFPQWASSHFGQTTQNFFLISHIPISISVVAICYLAGKTKIYSLFGVVLSSLLLVNGLFHLVSSVAFKEYSPGVLTGITFYTVTYWHVVRWSENEGQLSKIKILKASCIGAFISILIVGSLYIDMPAL